MFRCCAALAVLVLALPTLAADKIVKETLTSGGKTREYFLYAPGTLKSDVDAPLLVLLHGSGRDGRSLVEPWQDLAKREGIILAGPNATDRAQWELRADSPYLFADLVDAVRSNHQIDPRRIYLFGHSAGAVHSLMMGLLESEYFAAVGVHAGALPESSLDLIDYHDRKIPIAIWVGTNDRFFPMSVVEATKTAMEARGLSVRLQPINGHSHDYYRRAREINRDAWDFLKAHRLSHDPKFREYDLK